jgi:hypothetical protein
MDQRARRARSSRPTGVGTHTALEHIERTTASLLLLARNHQRNRTSPKRWRSIGKCEFKAVVRGDARHCDAGAAQRRGRSPADFRVNRPTR